MSIKVVSETIDDDYLEKFKNLRTMDVSEISFTSFSSVKTLICYISRSLEKTYVDRENTKELFVLSVHARSCLI